MIYMFAGNQVPNGYLECDGTAVSRDTYSELFSAIGTIFGAGDGSTTFNLPDLSGKIAIGSSQSHVLGSSGGSETVTLVTDELPQHTHEVAQHGHTNNITATTPSLSHTVTQAAFTYAGPGSTGSIRNGAYPVTATGLNGTSTVNASRTNASIAAHAATACTVTGSITDADAGTTSSYVSGSSHNNMQPYVTMMYIISVGEV
jgi:microcystin-dependent protein